ncbi:protein of unknown function [Beijerinckiaceae bacterium RH AL1]|nr:hypothetical protein [Beijerinckiaceae bacterium]VVB42145.1 protein of unknown function [Beijerinckiaceae bacterium RH AL8]VVB42146.1 protein of unknown function [Beijerinckiaceae bacterium RH CH11]VVC53161.1 protein of unknown function [Beijerinckiaceae bacterium RH AL1]
MTRVHRKGLNSARLVVRHSTLFSIRTENGYILPVLCFGADILRIDIDLMRFAYSLLIQSVAEGQVRSRCFTIALFYDYCAAYSLFDLYSERQLPTIVNNFLRARRNGICPGETSITWRPVMRTTVERDRQAIADFSDFCIQSEGGFALLPRLDVSKGNSAYVDALRRLARRRTLTRDNNLLYHLSGFSRPAVARQVGIPGRTIQRQSSRAKDFLRIDEIRRVIDKTARVSHKMLLIEAFFCGPRLSEPLHRWRVDTLPGSQRQAIFPDDLPSALPVVLYAHPSQSTYTGRLYSASMD